MQVDQVDIRLTAQNTTWHAAYAVPVTGGETTEIPTGREVHVPVGAEVTLELASVEYVGDFELPELGLRDFAAPGLPSRLHFRADHAGRYNVRGDELCGRPHTERSRGWLVVENADAFQNWVQKRSEILRNER